MMPVNNRKPGNVMYAVTYKGERQYFWANSEAAARQLGTEHFKLKKKEVILLSIELVVYSCPQKN